MSSRNWPDDVTMTFGQYKGRTLADILDTDAAYLRWLYEDADVRSEELRAAIQQINEDHDDQITEASMRRRFRREED
jgi:uncharacterized protein (DUF3820 family)